MDVAPAADLLFDRECAENAAGMEVGGCGFDWETKEYRGACWEGKREKRVIELRRGTFTGLSSPEYVSPLGGVWHGSGGVGDRAVSGMLKKLPVLGRSDCMAGDKQSGDNACELAVCGDMNVALFPEGAG